MSVIDYDALIVRIDDIIKTNGIRGITAVKHNPLLKDISDTLKALGNQFVDLTEDVANEYSGTPASALNSYVEGTRLLIKADITNTGAVLINVSGLGQLSLVKQSGASLIPVIVNDLRAGIFYECVITSTAIQLLPSEAAAGGGGGDLLAANNLADVANAATSYDNIKQAATTSATGAVELATTSEVDTGTDNSRVITPLALKDSSPAIKATNISELVDIYVVSISPIDGDLIVATVKESFLVRYAGTITEVSGSVETAPTDASIIIDVNKNGTTVMTTDKIKIDTTETDSKDAATQPALTTTAVAANDKISFDVDQIGSTVAGAGGKVYVHIKRT